MEGHFSKIAIVSILLLLFVSSAAATLVVFGGTLSPAVPSTPINLSNDANNAIQPNVFNVGGHVYVAWSEASYGVFFRESSDEGATWSPPTSSPALKLNRSPGVTQSPLISANGSNVYVVWSQNTGSGTTLQVYVAYSTNYGQSFSETNITDVDSSVQAITPVIASWGQSIVVAWTSGTGSTGGSYVRSSTDGGVIWNKPFKYGSIIEPQVSIWGTQDMYAISDQGGFAYSHDGGLSWTEVTSNVEVGSEPWIATWGSNVYIAGEGKGSTSQVEYTVSRNYGASFQPVTNISEPLQDAWAPMLWSYSSNVWIAFRTYPGGNAGAVFVITSHDNGTTFSSPIQLSQTGTTNGFPFTVWSNDGSDVFTAWPQEVGTTSTWILRSAYSGNSGNSWTLPPGYNMSQNSLGQGSNQNDVANAAISANGPLEFATWQYIPVSGNSQIYFTTLYEGVGSTTTSTTTSSITTTTSSLPVFSAPVNLSSDTYQAEYPWVANSGNNVFVAWTEESHGIWFRASSDNGASWGPSVKLSPNGGVAQYPIAYATGSDVYVVWSQTVNQVLQLFFAASTDSGTSFSTAIQLTSGSSSNGFITPVMTASGSDVYIAYTANGKNSYVIASDSYGAAGTWTPPFLYSATHEPQIAAVGSNAYAIADGVGIAVTNNGGQSWTIVSSSTNEGDEPWIAASGQYVYVVSQTKTSNGNIHFFYSNNFGKPGSWTSEPGVDISGTLTNTWEPQLTVSGSYLFVTFHDLTSPITNYVVVSSDNGKSWSSPQVISGSANTISWPYQIATSGCGGGYSCSGPAQYVFTVWSKKMSSTNWQLFVTSSPNYGTTWAQPINVSNNPSGDAGITNDIATASIAANGSHALVAWMQNDTSGLYQVYFSGS